MIVAEEHPTPAASPALLLALDARYVAGLLADPARQPARWSSARFRREVALVRTHLQPVMTRAALAASYGREAFHVAPGIPAAAPLAMSAVRVAYAERWLELGDRQASTGYASRAIVSGWRLENAGWIGPIAWQRSSSVESGRSSGPRGGWRDSAFATWPRSWVAPTSR